MRDDFKEDCVTMQVKYILGEMAGYMMTVWELLSSDFVASFTMHYCIIQLCYHIAVPHTSAFGVDTSAQVRNKGGHTYLQMASKHSSMVSLCALVRDRPLESLYIVCSVESIREVQCSVPEKRGAHLVRSGSTAEHRYLLSASADSVVLRDT